MSKSHQKVKKPVKPAKSSATASNVINLEQIRQAGICSHYDNLKKQGVSSKECFEQTREFARNSPKQLSGILGGRIQPTGKKTGSFEKYLQEIDTVNAELSISGSIIKSRTFSEIRRSVIIDPKLTDEEKQALNLTIENSIKEMEKLSQKQDKPTPEPQFGSLVDAIKNFDTSSGIQKPDDEINFE
jgi:hypothetical protein